MGYVTWRPMHIYDYISLINRSVFTSAQHLFLLITIGLHVSTVIQSSSGPSHSCKLQEAVRTFGIPMCPQLPVTYNLREGPEDDWITVETYSPIVISKNKCRADVKTDLFIYYKSLSRCTITWTSKEILHLLQFWLGAWMICGSHRLEILVHYGAVRMWCRLILFWCWEAS